jgi:hypothetical protein
MTRAPLYPSKAGPLSKLEAEQVHNHGPNPTWFEPWAQHVVLFPGVVEQVYGLIHVHGDQSDVSTWDNPVGLSHGLDDLWRVHADCGDCGGVLYFALDEPSLRAVIELDDEDEEAGE